MDLKWPFGAFGSMIDGIGGNIQGGSCGGKGWNRWRKIGNIEGVAIAAVDPQNVQADQSAAARLGTLM